MSIMKFAVCSISSTASRKPPSDILGTLAVAALPTGFARRSSILFVSPALAGWMKFADDDADQLALGVAEGRDDLFHAVVDVEICRQGGDEAVGHLEQLAAGGAPWHRRPVENQKIIAAGGARPR